MRIPLHGLDAPGQHGNPLARRAATHAGGANRIGVLIFGDGVFPVADEAAPGGIDNEPFGFSTSWRHAA